MSTVCSKVCSRTVKSKTEDAPSWLKSLAFVVLTVVCFPADLSNEAYWVGVSWQSCCLCVAVWFRLLQQLTFLSQIWFLFIQKQLKTNIWPTFYFPKKIESWWLYIRHNVSWTVYLKGSGCIMWWYLDLGLRFNANLPPLGSNILCVKRSVCFMIGNL